jgi:hypothetical protein
MNVRSHHVSKQRVGCGLVVLLSAVSAGHREVADAAMKKPEAVHALLRRKADATATD